MNEMGEPAMKATCFDMFLDIMIAVGTVGSAVAAVWLGLKGDRCRIDGIFLRDSRSADKPVLWIRNISNRMAVLDYIDIFYDEKLLKRLDFSKDYSLKNYAIIHANGTVEVPIDSAHLEIDEDKYKNDENKKYILKFVIKHCKGRRLVLRHKLSFKESKDLFFLEGMSIGNQQ